MRAHLSLSLTLGLLFSFPLSTALVAQTPAVDGEWGSPFPLPLISIHAATLPTGAVLLFGSEHGVPGIHGWVLDPVTLGLTEVPPGWDLNCSGHSFLSDGRLLVTGGTLGFAPLTGPVVSKIFDPFTLEWTQVDDMAQGRWYPTNLTLADGRVITLSGLNDSTGALNEDIEVYDPDGITDWQLVGQKLIPYYPLLHLLPNGLIFSAGPAQLTETYDLSSDTWTTIGPTIFPGRYEAPSVLLPPTLDRVMVIGGFTGAGAPTHSAEIIDFSDPVPQWSGTASMTFPRMEHDAVILPTGDVLVVGGRSTSGSPSPVLTPEVFDPLTEAWDTLAPHQVPRMYHSTSILLSDGRVLAAGGDFEPTGEIFSPPYLFLGPRPVVGSAPTSLGYGVPFTVDFTSATPNNEIVLLRLSSVTHSLNMGQRYVRLAEGIAGGAAAIIPGPVDGNSAPPGYYMLFVVDETGVPSVSWIVQVEGTPAGEFRRGDCNSDGGVDLADAISTLDSLFGGTGPAPCEDGCDANDDGTVDISDPIFSLLYLFGSGVPSLPAPFPDCGLDPSADGIDCAAFTACP